MKEDTDITTKNVFSTKQLIIIIGFAISITFYVTMIYSEFVLMRSKIDILDQRANKRYERMNQNSDNIWTELNKLKEDHK